MLNKEMAVSFLYSVMVKSIQLLGSKNRVPNLQQILHFIFSFCENTVLKNIVFKFNFVIFSLLDQQHRKEKKSSMTLEFGFLYECELLCQSCLKTQYLQNLQRKLTNTNTKSSTKSDIPACFRLNTFQQCTSILIKTQVNPISTYT